MCWRVDETLFGCVTGCYLSWRADVGPTWLLKLQIVLKPSLPKAFEQISYSLEHGMHFFPDLKFEKSTVCRPCTDQFFSRKFAQHTFHLVRSNLHSENFDFWMQLKLILNVRLNNVKGLVPVLRGKKTGTVLNIKWNDLFQCHIWHHKTNRHLTCGS